MFPAAFDYRAPGTLAEVLGLLREHGDDAKVMAGGQSLIPLLKLRLAAPALVVDLGRLPALRGLRWDGSGCASRPAPATSTWSATRTSPSASRSWPTPLP
jgi:CO/xanthine dehydrogenase FAD-binding subunit